MTGALLVLGARGPCADPDAPQRAAAGDETVDASPAARTGGASAAGRRVAPSTSPVPPALAALDPATLARAAELVRRARDYERRALQATSPDSTAGRGDAADGDGAVRDPELADSARRAYAAAAALAPDVSDWLHLRRLALEPDGAARAQLAAALLTPAARERAVNAEAMARLRAGDLAGAAAAYEAAARPAAALAVRYRVAVATNAGPASPTTTTLATGSRRDGVPGASANALAEAAPADLDAVRAALLRLAEHSGAEAPLDTAPRMVAGESPGESARRAAVLLGSLFAPLAPAERLVVARALGEARARPAHLRAAAAYAAAFAGGVGTDDDRVAHARLLARLGRWREAAAAYSALPAGSALAPTAAYGRAHALLRAGDGGAARVGLARVAAEYSRDSSAAAARLLLAELAAEDGDAGTARTEYLRLARELPDARLAPVAAYRAGLLAMTARDAAAAIAAFDLAATRWPDAPDAQAARYWAGRAHAAAGDTAAARARWTDAIATGDPASYHAWLAARRLGRVAWAPPAGTPIRRDLAPDAAARRAALCERLGLGPEAGYERDWVARWADTSAARMLAGAAALVETNRPGPGIRMAQRAVARGAAPSAAVWRLLYPLPYAAPLAEAARAHGVDPTLAAALVKQESNFTADAVSPAGARGLMQVMPSVGRGLWRGPGAWSPALLFRPEVNIPMGMRHLRAALAGWPDPAYALAAYNAGAGRVRRWRQWPGAEDPELFAERIPFAETREYVRVVLRNQAFYRALYAF